VGKCGLGIDVQVLLYTLHLLLQLLKFLKFSKARSTNVSSAQFRFIELHIAGFSHSMRDNITQYWHDMLRRSLFLPSNPAPQARQNSFPSTLLTALN
jgi:hypothetical protein